MYCPRIYCFKAIRTQRRVMARLVEEEREKKGWLKKRGMKWKMTKTKTIIIISVRENKEKT